MPSDLPPDRQESNARPFLRALRSRIGHTPKSGNRVDLLQDGPQTHAAQLAAITSARHHVHLETYLITDGEIGSRYADAMTERARAGVKVRLMLDGHGALGAGDAYRRRLLDAGVEIREFNSVNPFKNPRVWRMTRRTHRKTLVIDGSVAFTGGVNITDEYRRAPDDVEPAIDGEQGWRDTHLRIEGPAVAEFQRVFLSYWARLGGLHDEQGCYPSAALAGDARVCAVTDQGEDFIDHLVAGEQPRRLHQLRPKYKTTPRIYSSYLDAIRLARLRVYVTQAYFAPNGRFIRALVAAARRGVDVHLVLPAHTDARLLKYAARQRYGRLLRAGVHISEYQPAVLHAKTAVVDGIWSTVGSANLDYRSFFHNDEANAFIVDAALAAQMEEQFQRDLARSTPIERRRWRKRGWFERVLENFAGAIRWLL